VHANIFIFSPKIDLYEKENMHTSAYLIFFPLRKPITNPKKIEIPKYNEDIL